MKKIFFVLAAGFISNQLSSQDSVQRLPLATAPAQHVNPKMTENELDPVTVTAARFSMKTSRTGKVVTIISRQQLERSGGKDLSQVLAEQTGITIAGSGSNPGKEKSPYLRGARIEHTLICINGIPVYDPSGIGGNFDLRNITVDNIERIEILKGSQSTLYGSDAIAGVINIITRRPQGQKPGGHINAAYGSWQTFNGSAGINQQAGKADYSADYSFHRTDGINEAVNNNSNTLTDRDGYTQHNLQLSAGYRPSGKTYLKGFMRYNNINGGLDQGAFTDELDYTYRQHNWQAGMAGSLTAGNTRINLLYSYNNTSRTYIDDSLKSRNGFDTYSEGSYKGSEHYAELYAVTSLKNSVKLTTGMDFRSAQSDQDYLSISFFGPFNSHYSHDSLQQNQFSIYGALNYEAKKYFSIEAGGRINFHSAYGNHAVFNINPSYLVNEKVKLFANLSSGYRTPSLYQLYSEYGNKKLKPEASISAEGGIQYIPGKKWMTRATIFSRNVKDVVFFYTNPSTFASQYINQDKQKDHGVELEFSWSPTEKIHVKGFYTYVTGNISTKKGSKDTTYNNLLRRPKNSGGISIGVQATGKLYISSNLLVSGKRYDSYFDTQSFQVVQATLKAYSLLDLYAEYKVYKNKLRVFTSLRNLLNEKYTEISGFNTQRLNVTGGVRWVF